MRTLLFSFTALTFSLASSYAFAHEHHHASTTTQEQGALSLSYDTMYMYMKGNRQGSDSVSTADIFSRGFMMAATDMEMQTHTVRGEYTFIPGRSLEVSLPYVIKDMDMVKKNGMGMSMHSEGIGDITVKARTFLREGFSAYAGLSLPTGSVKESSGSTRFGYMMQTGTGTYDPLLGVGYVKQLDRWSYGASADTVLRFGENDEGYRFGNEYNASVFAGRELTPYLSANMRVEGKAWGNVKGQDEQQNPMMAPSMAASMQGGQRVDAVLGMGVNSPSSVSGFFSGMSANAELGLPLYQHLDGPQLETDYHVMLSLQKRF